MIKVDKDYNDIPRALLSKDIEKAVRAAKDENGLTPHYRNLHQDKEVREKLTALYHNKCAYCEISLRAIDGQIDHFRPVRAYHWLAFEWSNLLPVCPECNKSKSDSFPLRDETKRITSPQVLNAEWLANSQSFLGEGALLVNPEIDAPEEHFSFFTDGRMEGLTERAKLTIDVLRLNRAFLIESRAGLISRLQSAFEEKVQYADELLSEEKSLDTKKAATILKLAFENTLQALASQTRSDKEFALLGRVMFQNFQKFFVDGLKNKRDAEILLKGLMIFKSEIFNRQNVTDFDLLSEQKEVQRPEPKTVSLKHMKIENIKCFGEITIDFENKNAVLLGINGRGKTSVLQLIALGLTRTPKPLFESEWKNVIRDNAKPAYFELALTYDKEDYLLRFTVDEEDRVSYHNPLLEKKMRLNRLRVLMASDLYYQGDVMLTLEHERLQAEILMLESNYKDMDFSNFLVLAYGTGRNAQHHGYPLNESFKNIASLFGINNLAFKNGEISDFLDQRNAFNQIKRIITQIFNQAEEIQNRVELKSFDKSTGFFFFVTPTNVDKPIPLDAMSSGFRTSFQWILDFVIQLWRRGYDLERPELVSCIVLIDEIDTHLHIKWQRKILHSLHEVFRKVQFIVTTHSPFVVQSLEENKIIGLQLNQKTNDVSLVKVDDISGSSYESIIGELFDEKSSFSVHVERLFDAFYKKREKILKREIEVDDQEFQSITKALIDKGEEVANIINRELRQINYLRQSKKVV